MAAGVPISTASYVARAMDGGLRGRCRWKFAEPRTGGALTHTQANAGALGATGTTVFTVHTTHSLARLDNMQG